MQVTVFLKTPFFVFDGPERHVPAEALAVVGELLGSDGAGLKVRVATYKDGRGRALPGAPQTLTIPSGKVDHLLHHEG